ncbi:MAG: HAD family hydrolase [bacterium]
MPKPKAVLYDFDGMLTHGERFSDKYAQEFGIDIAVMSPFFDEPMKQCLLDRADLKEELEKVLAEWKWPGTVDELLEYWFAIGEIDKEAFASVAKLKSQGAVVCLATNQEKYRIAYVTKKFALDTIFDEIFCCTNLHAFKHNAKGLEKIYQTLKEKYGIENKSEIMYWDDRSNNVENLIKEGFNGQLYKDFAGFKETLSASGFEI